MKNLTIVLFVMFVTTNISAQHMSVTSAGTNNLNNYYIDIISKAGTLNGSWGLFGGLRAGYNFNQNVSLGLVAHGLIPERLGTSYINQNWRDELHLGYGGLEAAYKQNLTEKLYLSGIMMIGAARVDYEVLDGNDYFFIMEPGASLNYRIIDWFGVGYAINYRFASGVKYAEFSNASFSGWSTSLDLKFGF